MTRRRSAGTAFSRIRSRRGSRRDAVRRRIRRLDRRTGSHRRDDAARLHAQALPYEVAFENWRNDSTHLTVSDDRDILETTAIAANKRMDRSRRVAARAFERRRSRGLRSRRPAPASERRYADDRAGSRTARWSRTSACRTHSRRSTRNCVSPEPLHPEQRPADRSARATDSALRARSADRRRGAQPWVHDSICDRDHVRRAERARGAQNARRATVTSTRSSSSLWHARSALPARIAAGLAYVDGKFYYHAWPEVLLGDWVAVDPTFGQFPADAAHLRFIDRRARAANGAASADGQPEDRRAERERRAACAARRRK